MTGSDLLLFLLELSDITMELSNTCITFELSDITFGLSDVTLFFKRYHC